MADLVVADKSPKAEKVHKIPPPLLLDPGLYASQAISPSLASATKVTSPLGDVSVVGYKTDIKSKHHGAKEIEILIQEIEACRTSCCCVGEAALTYYGAGRTMFDWMICIPTENLASVVTLLESKPGKYETFRPSALNTIGSLNQRFPRFKLVGQSTFFVLLSSQACHLSVSPSMIEYDRWIRIPYPTLPVYAQSLLEMQKLADLEDLIDGMNLTEEWGVENLELEGTVDTEWAIWRERLLTDRELTEEELPRWTSVKRDIWMKRASKEAKLKRQGWKARPGRLTRFWREGQFDPREVPRDYA